MQHRRQASRRRSVDRVDRHLGGGDRGGVAADDSRKPGSRRSVVRASPRGDRPAEPLCCRAADCRRRGGCRKTRSARVSRNRRRSGSADARADDRTIALSHLFDDEARHCGCGDDAPRRRALRARRPRCQIHPRVQERRGGGRSGRSTAPGHEADDGARPAAAHVRPQRPNIGNLQARASARAHDHDGAVHRQSGARAAHGGTRHPLPV